jgi:parvulin-like peptidyl-prolyl isomerase
LNFIKSSVVTLALLTTASFCFAQSGAPAARAGNQSTPAPATANPATPKAPAESSVPESAPVITINGVCDVSTAAAKSSASTKTGPSTAAKSGSTEPAGNCKTQITRAEFEKLMKAVAPTAPAAARRQIAAKYSQLLIAANEGEKLGVDKDPEFKEQLRLMRLQLMAQNAERKLQANASNISDADAKTYYDQNPSAFEEVQLTRILVPRSSDSKIDAKSIADNIRQQFAAGGDADKLQKDAYSQVKNTGEPPSTKFGAKRRGTLPPAQEQQIFSLKQGEVSQVIPDSVGFVIYRVDSKRQLPFDDVKEDVKRRLTQQRLTDEGEKIFKAAKTDFNEAYFGPTNAPSPFGGPAQPSMKRPNEPAPAAPGATTTQPAAPPKH